MSGWAITAAVFSTITAACAQVPREPLVTERARIANERVASKQESTRLRLEKRLARLERQLARLRAKVVHARREGQALRKGYLEAMVKVERLAADARAELRDLTVSSTESFDRFRARLEADLRSLERGLARIPAE